MALSYYQEKSTTVFFTVGLWQLDDNPYAEITDASGLVYTLNDQWRSFADHMNEIHDGFGFVNRAAEPSASGEPLENFPGIWLETTMDRLHFKNIAGADKKIATLDDVLGLDWQNSVLDKDLTAPPGGESVGDRYIVAAGATGAWAGKDDDIAQVASISPTVWSFYTPTEGTVTEVEDENLFYHFDGASWGVIGAFVQHNNTGAKDGGTAGEYYHLTSAEYGGNWGAKNLITTGYLRGASLYFGVNKVFSTPGTENVFIGAGAGPASTGSANTLVGYYAGNSLGANENSNTLIGRKAGDNLSDTNADGNVFIGDNAGSALTASNRNIIIGANAGDDIAFSGLSNKLIIQNSASLTPLLYGDFSVPELIVNGDLKIPDDKKVIFGSTPATGNAYIKYDEITSDQLVIIAPQIYTMNDETTQDRGYGFAPAGFVIWDTNAGLGVTPTLIDLNSFAANVDTRIQGDTVVPLVYVDAVEDAVGIGKVPDVSTAFILDVNGKAKIQTDLTLLNGTNINEFSTDGTFAGNSDNAVPTEKAIKTYVDTTHHLFSLIRGANEYVESGSVAWEEIGTLVFVGTNSWTPVSAKVVSWRSASSGTYGVRLNDVTNSLIICTSAALSNTTEALNSLGTLSNLSTGEAIWKLEVQTSDGPTDMRINAIKII